MNIISLISFSEISQDSFEAPQSQLEAKRTLDFYIGEFCLKYQKGF